MLRIKLQKIAFLLATFVVASCSSLAAQSPQSAILDNENRDPNYYSSPVLPGAVRFIYQNTSDTVKCIRAEDFSRHPLRPFLRVKNIQSGAAQNYSGPLADRPIYFTEPGYMIVRSGQIIEATFDLSDNYEVVGGQTYSVSYSLPATACQSLLAESMLVPTASDPFYAQSAKPLKTWSERLEFVRGQYPEWSEVGEFIELEQTVSIPSAE
ncbi:MAG: hypothetical protein AAGC77_09180 [Pseudomonadota bacterium]